jgi:arylsulfatase A-like enzyme
MQDYMLRLDKSLAHFITFIDEQLGKQNVLFIVTAGHGLAYNPNYLAENKIPVGYFNANSSAFLLKSYLNNLYGKGDWIKSFENQQIYLNRTLIEDAKIDLVQVQNHVASFMLQFEGIANVTTANTMQTTNFTEGIFRKLQNSYNQKRSGDVLVNLKAGWVEKNEGSTNHSTSYSYDARVPLIWYGWKIGRKTINRSVDLVDIAPTVATFLEISYPNASTGNIILELVE